MFYEPKMLIGFAANVALLSLLISGKPSLCQQSTDSANENQIHEFHRHLARYNRGGKDLVALASKAPDKTVHSVAAPPAIGIMSSKDTDGERLFDSDVCRADALVIGRVTTFKVLLSADNSTVFTDYSITIDKVIENKSSVPLLTGNSVIVTLNGGTFRTSNFKIAQIGFDRPGPLIPTRSYLFMLKELSNGASFSISGSFAIEFIDNTGLHAVTEHPLRNYVNQFLETMSLDSIEQHVQLAVTNCASSEGR